MKAQRQSLLQAQLKPVQQLLQKQTTAAKPSAPQQVLFIGTDQKAKQLAVNALAKEANRNVYHADVSKMIPKHIGETEKNIDRIFKEAEETNAILFLDEADALFGKRSNVQDAHDKYANQEVSYLLQRIESHKGMVIIAAKGNIDTSFMRRFQVIVKFPLT